MRSFIFYVQNLQEMKMLFLGHFKKNKLLQFTGTMNSSY